MGKKMEENKAKRRLFILIIEVEIIRRRVRG